MDMKKASLIKELERRLETWKKDERVSLKEFLSDFERQNAVCYNMLVSIQSAIDLGNFVIEERKWEIPGTYAEVFQILEKNGFVDRGLAMELESMARFRNALAHLYWRVDLKRVYRALSAERRPLERFVKKMAGGKK